MSQEFMASFITVTGNSNLQTVLYWPSWGFPVLAAKTAKAKPVGNTSCNVT